jgi:transposase
MDTLYCGIDLHSNNNVVVVSNDEDKVVYRKRLRNEPDIVLNALSPFSAELQGIVVESTYNWYWLVDALMGDGHQVHLANTGAIQKYSGLKHADDESDARWLATLLRLNILPEGYIYPKEGRPIRDLLRKRMFLVQDKTSHLLSVINLFARNTGRRVSANAIKRLSDDDVDEMLPDTHLALPVKSSIIVIRCLDTEIKKLEKVALDRVRMEPGFQVLQSVPGIGTILGLTIMLEVGDIARFATVGDFASYARCVGSAHISNGKKKGKGNTKNGNKYLGWAFMEAASFAPRYDKNIERYYQRKKAKAHLMVAKKTIAHKLARACYCMLRDQTPFDVNKAFR